MGITQITSSAYHPKSQGALERNHQTLKSMLRKYYLEHEKNWDKGLPFVLFATRESPSESLGFFPFELLFGHDVRGPMKLLKEYWLSDNSDVNLLEYVSNFKERLSDALQLAKENLENSQGKMNSWYDKKATTRVFNPGDQVLLLLPIQGQPLQARFSGPYTVKEKINDVNYILSTPDHRRKTRMCHVNMMKLWSE